MTDERHLREMLEDALGRVKAENERLRERAEWATVWESEKELLQSKLTTLREENERLRQEVYLTYSYTCRDGHEETETLTIDEAIEAICEYRFRAEKAEAELADVHADDEVKETLR